jgi:hypothetical protein
MPTILFTTPGSGSWVKPVGVTRVQIECWGGGGNGGIRFGFGGRAAGGGGGGYASNLSGLVSNYGIPELVVPYYVAPGGQTNSDTVWGRDSSAPDWNVFNRVRAQTGRDGSGSRAGGGGIGLDGTTSYTGGSGSFASTGLAGGAGGGAASPSGNGFNASGITPGSGSGELAGNGGNPATDDATLYGGGAGAGYEALLSGKQGVIRITFDYPPISPFLITTNPASNLSQVTINPSGQYNQFVKY